jgi:transcription antitermination factor NusG
LPWFALRIKPQHEKTARLALFHKGFESYLPLYRSRRRWSDRYQELDLPLFPGYLFCRFSPLDKLRVETTPSVLSVVACGDRLQPVPESEIDAVRTMLASGLPVLPCPYLKEGNPVYVHRGPLQGLQGTLLLVKGTWRVVVSVTLFQRSVSVEVDRETVSPASASSRHPAARGAYA